VVSRAAAQRRSAPALAGDISRRGDEAFAEVDALMAHLGRGLPSGLRRTQRSSGRFSWLGGGELRATARIDRGASAGATNSRTGTEGRPGSGFGKTLRSSASPGWHAGAARISQQTALTAGDCGNSRLGQSGQGWSQLAPIATHSIRATAGAESPIASAIVKPRVMARFHTLALRLNPSPNIFNMRHR